MSKNATDEIGESKPVPVLSDEDRLERDSAASLLRAPYLNGARYAIHESINIVIDDAPLSRTALVPRKPSPLAKNPRRN
ncbi:MAG: hypothetical protein ACYC2K_09895 [Gemmatimonadales bacterium]